MEVFAGDKDLEHICFWIVFHTGEKNRCGIHFYLDCIPHGRKISMWNTFLPGLYSTWPKIIDVEYSSTLNCIPHGWKIAMWNTLDLELYSTWPKNIDVEYSGP